MKKLIVICTAMTLITGSLSAAKKDEDKLPLKKQAEIINSISRSIVIVEYTLKFDKGTPPEGAEVSYMCPNCGSPHTRDMGAEVIREERPIEEVGYLIGPDTVVTMDTGLHSRFIESIRIQSEEGLIDAEIAAYAVKENAVFLKIKGRLEEKVPMKFTRKTEKPYIAVTHSLNKGNWTTSIAAAPMVLSVDEVSSSIRSIQPNSILLDLKGNPTAITMTGELPLDDSWKGSPSDWNKVSAENMNSLLSSLKNDIANAIPRVLINFRSPKSKSDDPYGSMFSRSMMSASGEESPTEFNTVGISIKPGLIMIPAALPPEITARLEKITVYDSNGIGINAKFKGSLKDYGAIIAETEKPLKNTVEFRQGDIRTALNELLLKADLKSAGSQLISHFWHGRIQACNVSFNRKHYPQIDGRADNLYFFDLDKKLVVLPLVRREKAAFSAENRWSYNMALPTPADHLTEIIADNPANYDPNNKPLSEEEEDRTAWMGVVLQKLDRELARAHNCSEQTQDGQTGALISYVYPDSPADKAGINPGMIILRLNIEGQPKPINIQIQQDMDRYGGMFSWQQLDQIPAQYLEQMPPPWPPINNSFTEILTRIGFGKKYTADLFKDGKLIQKHFTVIQSPAHYYSAAKYKDETLGITVKNLTFEVRRYMQKDKDAPGVIISKIETGGKTAIAGLKPFELVTRINGQPVKNIDEFETAAKQNGELMLSIERMNKSRQVRIKLKNEPSADQPGEDEVEDIEIDVDLN